MIRAKKLLITTAAIAICGQVNLASAKDFKPEIKAANISQTVRIISSDEFEGRGVGTQAETKTINYIANALKDTGFEPAGDNGTWFQNVELRRFEATDPVINLNIGASPLPLEVGKDITVSSRGTLNDVSFANAPLVFVGYGITAPERQWNDFKDKDGKEIDVKGKIIVVLVNDADYYQPELNTFGGKAMTYYGRWTYKYEEAARRGALGALIIHETGPAAYGWETVKNSNIGRKLDIVREDPSKVSPQLESWISYDVAQKLFSAAGEDLEALKVAARSKDFYARDLKNVSLSGAFKMKTETITSHNVVGILKGQKRPDEYVLYSAHWDHLGIGLPNEKGDNIFNGALDNATGVASIIEIARNYGKAPRPDRSILMLAWTAEESGLLGSEYYANKPLYPLEKTVAGINIDGINIVGPAKNFQITGKGQSNLEDTLERYAQKEGRYLTAESKPEAGGFFRSDHFPFAKRGVPFLVSGSGIDLVNGGEKRGKELSDIYTARNYHQPSDEWSPDWDLTGAVQDLTIYFKIGYDLANSTKWPEWKKASEFKAVRDKSSNIRK